MSTFRVTYKLDDGEDGEGTLTGPTDATVEQCEKIAKLSASRYEIQPDTIKAESIEESPSCGFLHPLEAYTDDGRIATITNWYF